MKPAAVPVLGVTVMSLTVMGLTAFCSGCASNRSSDLDFDEKGAVKIQVEDDLILVDGTPASLQSLPALLDSIYGSKGVVGRRSALVLIRYTPKPGENIVEFERRKRSRTQDVLDALAEAGARNIHLGPVSGDGTRPNPKDESQP